MVGVMIAVFALFAFLLVVALAYLWPGPGQGRAATRPDGRDNEQPTNEPRGADWPMAP